MLIYDDYKENYYISKALLIESNQFMKNIMNLGKKKKKKRIFILNKDWMFVSFKKWIVRKHGNG